MLTISILLLPTPGAIGDPDENEEQENKSILSSSIKPANEDPEVYTLDTWKSKVRGSQQGDKLIGVLNNLDASLVRNFRDVHSLYMRGHLYGTVGCTNAAIVDLTKVIQTEHANLLAANAYCERGICFFDNANYDRAIKDLDKAVELNPNSGDARLARGRLLLWLGKPLAALTDLLCARYENLDFATPLPGELPANHYRAPDYYLGVCYEALNRPQDALYYYKEASNLPSTHGAGYLHRYAEQPADVAECVSRLGGRLY